MDFISPGIAGGLGFLGQTSANRENRREAQRNRDWNERMAGSNYQRMMKDMESAGLNPILGLSSGGSAVPGGANANSQSSTEKGVGSALEARRLRADLANLEAMNKKINSDTSLNETNTRLNAQRILLDSITNASEVALRSAQAANLGAQVPYYGSQSRAIDARSAKDKATAPIFNLAAKASAGSAHWLQRSFDEVTGAIGSGYRDLRGGVSQIPKHASSVGKRVAKFYRANKRDSFE